MASGPARPRSGRPPTSAAARGLEAINLQMRTTFLSIAIAALMLIPAASAEWRALGSIEPDTSYDVNDGWMYDQPNQEMRNKVYFNVVAVHGQTATNPNSATLGESRILPGHYYSFEAFYGVWVDCNLDGYIGAADTALFEYRSELLLVDGPCRGNSLHNQQGWVSEMRFIGRHGGADSADPDDLPDGRDNRVISDYGSDVWGDRGLPGTPIALGAEGCSTNYHRTGQLLNRADCALRTVVDTEPAGALLGFQEGSDGSIDYDQANPLNVGLLGEDDASDSMVAVWDCGNEQHVDGGSPDQEVAPIEDLPGGFKSPGLQITDSDGHLNLTLYSTTNTNGSNDRNNLARVEPSFYAPGSGSTTTNGGIAGTWNHTLDGAAGDCDPDNRLPAGASLYALESQEDVRQPGKSRVDIAFRFFEEQRSGAGKRGEPFDRGVYPVVREGVVLFSGSHWFSNNVFTGTTNSYPIIRADLEPAGPQYFTFYANMSVDTPSIFALELPSGGVSGMYGTEWCRGVTYGVVDGFNCNPNEWYLEADGSRATANEFEPFAGHMYQLRDIDCYDNHVTNGVYVSGAALDSSKTCSSA